MICSMTESVSTFFASHWPVKVGKGDTHPVPVIHRHYFIPHREPFEIRSGGRLLLELFTRPLLEKYVCDTHIFSRQIAIFLLEEFFFLPFYQDFPISFVKSSPTEKKWQSWSREKKWQSWSKGKRNGNLGRGKRNGNLGRRGKEMAIFLKKSQCRMFVTQEEASISRPR